MIKAISTKLFLKIILNCYMYLCINSVLGYKYEFKFLFTFHLTFNFKLLFF